MTEKAVRPSEKQMFWQWYVNLIGAKETNNPYTPGATVRRETIVLRDAKVYSKVFIHLWNHPTLNGSCCFATFYRVLGLVELSSPWTLSLYIYIYVPQSIIFATVKYLIPVSWRKARPCNKMVKPTFFPVYFSKAATISRTEIPVPVPRL